VSKSDAHKLGNLTTNYAYNLASMEAGMCNLCSWCTDVIASLLGDSNLYKKLPKHVRGWGCQVCHEKTVPTGKLSVTILIFLIVMALPSLLYTQATPLMNLAWK